MRHHAHRSDFRLSPNDALAERQRVSRVVGRLNVAFRDRVKLEALRWEKLFYSGHTDFQGQTIRPSECDIVIGILRGRIGSPLPSAFIASLPPEEKLPSGEEYASGTAYEILSAIAARHRSGTSPDVYVFEWKYAPTITIGDRSEPIVKLQWEKLEAFKDKIKNSEKQDLKGATQAYDSLDGFEQNIEDLLRQWLEEHVFKGKALRWPIETKGSPFRSLDAFGPDHAEVFFGRKRDIRLALDQLIANAKAGHPFLLILGPSGVGKSSLAQAGLLPVLTVAGTVPDIGLWRAAVVRAGSASEGGVADPVLAFARALLESGSTGCPAALPELKEGSFRDLTSLAVALRHGDRASLAPIADALQRASEAEKGHFSSERTPQARLLVILDQIEELFRPDVSEEMREQLARLLDTLMQSGLVWVVGTLRVELYAAYLASALGGLGQEPRLFGLASPGLAEMADIVRLPAAAAGLVFERDPRTGMLLDERLLADIDKPDLLPILQFVLQRRFDKCVSAESDDPDRLTFEAYEALGGLNGAIAFAANKAMGELGHTEDEVLSRLLRTLVVPAQRDDRSAPSPPADARSEAAAPDPASRSLDAGLTWVPVTASRKTAAPSSCGRDRTSQMDTERGKTTVPI